MDPAQHGMHTAMKRGKLQAKATFTPAPFDFDAIRELVDGVWPTDQHRSTVYACLAEIERLTNGS